MNKSIKVLVVVNGAASSPIAYSSKVNSSLEDEIRTACNELDIENDNALIDDIENEILHGRVYWHDETYCFDVIPVEL